MTTVAPAGLAGEWRSTRASIMVGKRTMFSKAKFALILFALTQLLRFVAWRHPRFAARLKERNLVAQIKARDEGTGRWIDIRDGKIRSGAGQHPKPDITLFFKLSLIHISEPTRLGMISYAVFCLKKKNK